MAANEPDSDAPETTADVLMGVASENGMQRTFSAL